MGNTPLKQKVALSFRWKKGLGRPECIAILYAVHYGYQDAQALQQALPQFSRTRLESALTDLLASQLVEVLQGQLVLSEDALRLDQMTQSSPLIIPAPSDELSMEEKQALLRTLDITNTALAVNAIYINSSPLVESL